MFWSEEAVEAEVQYRRARASRAPLQTRAGRGRSLWDAMRAAQWPRHR